MRRNAEEVTAEGFGGFCRVMKIFQKLIVMMVMKKGRKGKDEREKKVRGSERKRERKRRNWGVFKISVNT